MLVVLGAIKAAHARARERVKVGGGDADKYAKILKHMETPRFRKGHYGTVNFLKENDAPAFDPGAWYRGSEFGTAGPGVNKQKSFVALRDALTQNDEDNCVDDKFVWEWYTCRECGELMCEC